MAIYERLIKLYQHSNSRTPFEDFTTEILAGILETHSEILDSFIKNIIKIEGVGYHVRTQRTYRLSRDKSVRIDLILENEETICFIENKVESFEGADQLNNYSEVLSHFDKDKKYLRYCTKYFDPKDREAPEFLQFRWSDIATMLFNFINKPQIEDFYNFLKNHSMANSLEITAKEIFLLENLKQSINVLDEFLDRIKPAFESTFGKINNPDNTSQIRKFGRYVFLKTYVFGEGAMNEIGVGFTFNSKPSLIIWIWTGKNNSKRDDFNKLAKKRIKTFSNIKTDYCSISMDLSSFLASSNPVEEIEKWYTDKFILLREFIDETPELEWKVLKRVNK